jgi:hypothetical protein
LSALDSSIVPDANVSYDLGSTTNAFRDLYLSGNSIFLGAGEITSSANGSISLPAGSLVGDTEIGTGSGGGAGVVVYANTDVIPLTNNSVGDLVLVQDTNIMYVWSGSGWYKIATVNDSPTPITGVLNTYGSAPNTSISFTANSTDPEGFGVTWSFDTSAVPNANVSNIDNQFSIVSNNLSEESFTLIVKASDGINIVSKETIITFTNYVSLIADALWVSPLSSPIIENHSTNANALDTGEDELPYGVDYIEDEGPNSLGALLFDGVESIKLSTGGFHGSGDFICVSLWTKLTSLNDQVFFSDGGAGNGFCLNLENSTIYYGGSDNSTQYAASFAVDSNDLNVWIHLFGEIDKPNGTIKLYRDNVLQDTVTKGSAFGDFNGNNEPYLGSVDVGAQTPSIPTTGSTGTSHILESYISDLYIFDTQLTTAQRNSLAGQFSQLSMDISFQNNLQITNTPSNTNAPLSDNLYNTDYTGDLTLQCTIPFESSLSSGVYSIWEAGGEGTGAALGVIDGKLFWVCGSMNGEINIANNSRSGGISTLDVPTDGNTHLVTMVFDHSRGGSKVYIGNTLYIDADAGDFGSTATYGSDSGSYLVAPWANLPAGSTGDVHPLNESSDPNVSRPDVWPYTDAGDLGTLYKFNFKIPFPDVITQSLVEPL